MSDSRKVMTMLIPLMLVLVWLELTEQQLSKCCCKVFFGNLVEYMYSDFDPHVGYTDSLVLNIQLIYDGDIPHWACVNDPHEDTTQ